MADETIIIKYVVDAKDAIGEAEKMRQLINKSKEEVKSFAEQAKVSFKDMGKTIENSLKSLKFDTKGIESISKFLDIKPETIQNQQAFGEARQKALYIVKTATTELGVEERAQATASARTIKAEKAQEKQAQVEYEKVTKQGYGVMSSAATAYGQQVALVKQQIVSQAGASGQTYQQVAQQMQQAGTSANVLNSALKQLQTGATQTKTAFSSFGNTLKTVFVALLGLNIANALRQVISLMKEAAQVGYELAKSYFQLEVGVRALRRAGVDITSQEMLDNLDMLSEKFGVFAKKDLVQGAAAFANLIRDMGFTKDQIFELQDAVATLAVVNGRAMDDVQKTVALALSSGYTEGLQRLGVSINRVNIAARGMAMGFAEGYNALTEQQRAIATYSLLIEKTAKYSDDLVQYQKTLAGQIDTTAASIIDQKAALGDELLPIQLEYNKALLNFIKYLTEAVRNVMPFVVTVMELKKAVEEFGLVLSNSDGVIRKVFEGMKFLVWAYKAVLAPITFVWKALDLFRNSLEKLINLYPNLLGGITDFRNRLLSLVGVTPEIIEKLSTLDEVIRRIFNIDKKDFSAQVEVGTPQIGEGEGEGDAKEKIAELVKELNDDIEKEELRHAQKMADIDRDLARDLIQIEIDLERDLRDLRIDYYRDKDNIIEEGERKRTKAIADYNRKVAEEERKYQQSLIDEDIKYRENQIKAEIDFQEKMRKLREGFLFDLEDALRERDARQVLNLIRRYNLDKDQASRDFEIQMEEMRREHSIRIAELARERDERLAMMAEEQALKLAQIAEETRLELEERRLKYEQDKIDAAQAAVDKETDRKQRWTDQMEDEALEHKQRLESIGLALSQERDMTAGILAQIAAEYAKTYGPGGLIDLQLDYYIAKLAAIAQAVAKMNLQPRFGNLNQDQMNLFGTSAPTGLPKAEGGIMYANKPTSVLFGERGLERAEFTPINYTGRNEGKITSSDVNLGGGNGGRISLRVSLSPDLIAEIQENTLDKAAEVLFEVQRRAQ